MFFFMPESTFGVVDRMQDRLFFTCEELVLLLVSNRRIGLRCSVLLGIQHLGFQAFL